MQKQKHQPSNVGKNIGAALFVLLGIAVVVIMDIVLQPIEASDIDTILAIASFGTVPIVIGIMMFLSDMFDGLY